MLLKIDHSAEITPIIPQASAVLQAGGVIVCATDTGYLLGVDGLNPAAIKKIYHIKGRDFRKPLHLVVADLEMAQRLAVFSPPAVQIFEQFLPGPLTVILKRKPCVPDILVGGLDTVGLRIPDNQILLEFVKAAGTPITATSANRSGQLTPYTVAQVRSELGKSLCDVDLIIDQGETAHAMPSTILDLSRSPTRVLREGPITQDMLSDFLDKEGDL